MATPKLDSESALLFSDRGDPLEVASGDIGLQLENQL